jgi:hypothetical protein
VASVALRVGQIVLPAHRSKCSKRRFTQPQLLAMVCLMRYEDWTFGEAEVRLAEHRDRRAALGLTDVPNDTTLDRFLRRLDGAVIEQALTAAIRELPVPQEERGTTVAVDATDVASGAISTFLSSVPRIAGTASLGGTG